MASSPLTHNNVVQTATDITTVTATATTKKADGANIDKAKRMSTDGVPPPSITRYGPSADETFRAALETVQADTLPPPLPAPALHKKKELDKRTTTMISNHNTNNNNNSNSNNNIYHMDFIYQYGIYFFSYFEEKEKPPPPLPDDATVTPLSVLPSTSTRCLSSPLSARLDAGARHRPDTSPLQLPSAIPLGIPELPLRLPAGGGGEGPHSDVMLPLHLAEAHPVLQSLNIVPSLGGGHQGIAPWCYVEDKNEEAYFIHYALEWENAFEVVVLLRQERLHRESTNSLLGTTQRDGTFRFMKKVFAASPHQRESLNSRVDHFFAKMAQKNANICEMKEKLIRTASAPFPAVSRVVAGSGCDDTHLAHSLRRPLDSHAVRATASTPRGRHWSALATALRSHQPHYTLHTAQRLLDYCGTVGDRLWAVTAYLLLGVWWRVRYYDRTNGGVVSTPCALLEEESWRLKALQWLDGYTALLHRYALHTPLHELLLLLPELFPQSHLPNPIVPKAVDMLYERQMTYAYCGAAQHREQKSELLPQAPRTVALPFAGEGRAEGSSDSELSAREESADDEDNDDDDDGMSLPINAACHRCPPATTLPHCVICGETVRGVWVWWRCGHGGHVEHCVDWSSVRDRCPQCGGRL